MGGKLHLIKLSVGSESVEDFVAWQEGAPARNLAQGLPEGIFHVTRMWPRREAELLDGGSIYWVIRGLIQARQRLLSLDERIGQDGIRRCALRLDPQVFRVRPQAKRPFQGWRYLNAADAPEDLGPYSKGAEDLPPEMQLALDALGVR